MTESTVAGAEGTAKAGASAAPAKAPASKAATVAAAAAATAPEADRWQMFADALATCGKEHLFGRFVCEQKARVHYCEGYWGKVPQCPATPPVERGQ